ncbi:MBL fold metallo-hydrolase [Iamia sp. SCSIO 61187]|uniref:MBL fold metallo-hydrolase n=1 Tax=Iamia sp. SCSIO 61187 TaxID=2722752 RepID=UPI001C62DF9B|nr:MBL fold metallo-hydrolase [Iamia sp. SCSIO 61187]QYG94413.1 MBL fold metallo-hydrolase [Iamia sp. SCSIO 61187]
MTAPVIVPAIEELPAGTLRAQLPTPFPVGTVNCYLLLGSTTTVVDPGMMWSDSTSQLQAFLTVAGIGTADVDAVVVTHGHPDHFGAAGWLAELADAPVVCGRAELTKLRGEFGRTQRSELSERVGIPGSLRADLATFYDGVRSLTTPIADHRLLPVDDLDPIELGGRTWTAHVTPGHATGHLSLHDPAGDMLLSGDHLLGHITPNPVLEPDDDVPDGRRRSLSEYLGSLDRFTAMDPGLVLPGHGSAFTDVPALVAHTRDHHAARALDVLDIVRSCGQPTAFEVAIVMFPELEGFSRMLGVSEALGHLDLLEDDGMIMRVEGSPIRFRPT